MSVIVSASAFGNNSVGYVAWRANGKVPGCVGFELTRIYKDGSPSKVLASWVPFQGQSNPQWLPENTSVWPIQQFSWRDLTVRQSRNSTSIQPGEIQVKYLIRPLALAGGGLVSVQAPSAVTYTGPSVPLAYIDAGIQTDWCDITAEFGPVAAAFNSGILSTQWLVHALSAQVGRPANIADVKRAIKIVGNPIRDYLAGDLPAMFKSLFDRLIEGGELYLALYELTDLYLISLITANAKNVHLILSNTSFDKSAQLWDTENEPARTQLHPLITDMSDRMFNNSEHIGHNKFGVYVDANGVAQQVLMGSTNWTQNGLCAQSNNVMMFDQPDIAAQYLEYWHLLKTDNDSFTEPSSVGASTRNSQGKPLRTADATPLPVVALGPGNGTVQLWRSPNTHQATKPVSPALPPDLAELYGLMRTAKSAILFAVFLPGVKGQTSIIEEAIDIGLKDTSLLVYGTVSSAMAMPNYLAKDGKGGSDEGGDPTTDRYQPSLYEQGNVHVIRANALDAGDMVGDFQAEMLTAGNAIVHSKILVIDPMADDCVVVTGSHNLGYKASYANDDNLVIIRGNKALAQSYMVNILDLYEHYHFRGAQAELEHTGEKGWDGFLSADDSWLVKYPDGCSDLSKYLT